MTPWDRLTSIPTIEWIALIAISATWFIVRRLDRILELMEGPTGRCRYCQRRYASPEQRGFLDRTCDRRACQKKYSKYHVELHHALDAVRQRWKPDGALSDEDLERRGKELAKAQEDIEERYGGEPERRRDE